MKNTKYAIIEPERHGKIPVKKGCIQGEAHIKELTLTLQRPFKDLREGL